MTRKETVRTNDTTVVTGEASARPLTRDGSRSLPLFESLKALIDEIGELACNDALDAGARFKRLCALDAYAHAILDSALESSGRALGLSAYRRDPAVFLARDLYGTLLDGYRRCGARAVDESSDALRNAQVMRAAAERVKWERFAGGPAYVGLWQWAGNILRGTSEPTARNGDAQDTSQESGPATLVREGYLRALAFFSASYEQLSPDLFGVVSRIVEFSLPWLQLEREPVPGTLYYLDLEQGTNPIRFVQHPSPSGGLRYFSTGRAHAQLAEVRRGLRNGQLPAGFDLMPVKRAALAAAVDHLLLHWSTTPPVRRNRRHAMEGALDAVIGFDPIETLLSGASSPGGRRWYFTDVSRGGVGVRTESGLTQDVAIGGLVAIRPGDGGIWHLGMIQRVWRADDGAARIGVQTLSAGPKVVVVDDGLNSAAVLLCDPIQQGEAVRIVLPLGVLRTDVGLKLIADGKEHALRALGAHVAGQDFDLRAYQVV